MIDEYARVCSFLLECPSRIRKIALKSFIHQLDLEQLRIWRNLLACWSADWCAEEATQICMFHSREALCVFASIRVLYIVGCFYQVSSRIVFVADSS